MLYDTNLNRLLFINGSFKYVASPRGNLAQENRKELYKLPFTLESDCYSHFRPGTITGDIYFVCNHLNLKKNEIKTDSQESKTIAKISIKI